MFAILAAALFVVGACFRFHQADDAVFWGLLAFAAWALHHAYAVAVPTMRTRRSSE